MIEVEQRALGTLEEDVLAGGEGRLDERGRVHDPVAERRAPGQRAFVERLEVERLEVGQRGSQRVLLFHGPLERRTQDRRLQEIAQADAGPGRPIGIGRPDAAVGGADAPARTACLLGSVDGHVVGHDHVRRRADADALGGHAARRQHGHLVEQGLRVDDDAVADDRHDVGIQDAAGHQVQLEGLGADDDGVAGVVAALVAHDVADGLGQKVGRLAFALVAPLQADDHGGGHQSPSMDGAAALLRGSTSRHRGTKKPRSDPTGTWIDSPRCRLATLWRDPLAKVRASLTGPTQPLLRATAPPCRDAGLEPAGVVGMDCSSRPRRDHRRRAAVPLSDPRPTSRSLG